MESNKYYQGAYIIQRKRPPPSDVIPGKRRPCGGGRVTMFSLFNFSVTEVIYVHRRSSRGTWQKVLK